MLRKILIIVLFCVLQNLQASADKRFDSVVAFGDSLSDNGNLYRYMWGYLPLSPPYFSGRFSNGPVWAEYFFNALYGRDNAEGFQNYAVGGAGAVLSRRENLPYTLTFELNNYLYWNTYQHPERSLFSIWIGANNYLNGPTNVEELTTGVVNAIGDVTERLIQQGGNKFLIANLPELSRTPLAAVEGRKTLLRELIQRHNEKLKAKVEALKKAYPDATFLYFDIYAILEKAMNNPDRFELKNIEEPCFWGQYTGWDKRSFISPEMIKQSYQARLGEGAQALPWSAIEENPQLMEAARMAYVYHQEPAHLAEPSQDCEGYLFWDHVHPTSQVHWTIAQHALEQIEAEGLEAQLEEDRSEEPASQG